MLEAINTTQSRYQTARADGLREATYSPHRILQIALTVGAAIGISSLMVFALIRFQEFIAVLGALAYVGVFLAEFANSASVIIPLPGSAYTFAVSATLNPLIVGMVGGAAAGLGELVGYFIGARGNSAIPQGHMFRRMRGIMTSRWGSSALFAFALLPLPFDFAGVWAGMTSYPVARFVALVIAGKVIKVTAIAMSGYYSIHWLTTLIG
jgi:membrane protein YqaA with SNARE-associated domain